MPYSITCLDIWGEDVKGNPPVFKQAMDAFGASEAIGRVFAPILLETFLGMKELQVFSQQISPFEHETYLEIV